MQAVRTINHLQSRVAGTLVGHHRNRDYSSICRDGYDVDATTTGTQHTAEKLFRVTPKEATRC
jgi:hypothetical protein